MPQGGHRSLDGRQFRFWSNLKVPFYVNLWHKSVIQDIQSHIWWMKKQILCSKFSKKKNLKNRKMRKCLKTANFGHISYKRLLCHINFLRVCRFCLREYHTVHFISRTIQTPMRLNSYLIMTSNSTSLLSQPNLSTSGRSDKSYNWSMSHCTSEAGNTRMLNSF